MLKRKLTKISFLLLTLFIMIDLFIVPISVAKQVDDTDAVIKQLKEISEEIIEWKKSDIGTSSDDVLLNNIYLEGAGKSIGDWYPIGMGRIGYPDDYQAYLAVIQDVVTKRYAGSEQLHRVKSTEWHRIALAILAMGGDPTAIGKSPDGEPINLIRDGTYDRGKVNDLGAQGINGLTWGLITLDALRYEVPDDAYETRDDIIKRILSLQLEDGGFSLQYPPADVDITAMTIQALAPYYNSEQIYEYTRQSDKKEMKVRVRDVVDEGLNVLSELQLPNGTFASYEVENVESTIQVIVALTALHIDPLADERFIKNNNTLLDGILQFQMDDGGFIHSETYNPENPTSLPNESNSMASEQTLYGLAAMLRYYTGHRTLYDFREEMNALIKAKIRNVTDAIDQLNEQSATDEIEKAFKLYLDIPIEERSYVGNYYKLADVMELNKIENTSEPLSTHIGLNKNGSGTVTPIFDEQLKQNDKTIFTKPDLEQVEALPEQMTTEYDVEVVKLMDILQHAENKSDYEDILSELEAKKKEVESIKAEIDDLNKTIIDNLYPFESISIKDKKKIEEIIKRYEALAPYDQEKVQSYEDVEKAETQINSLIRARYLKVAGVIIVSALIIILSIRRKKRKQEKLKEKMFEED